MKKRGFFCMAVLALCITATYAGQNYTDLGTAGALTVTDEKISDAQVDTGSVVTVVTQEQIKATHPESTADLIGQAVGVQFDSVGAIGALQNVNVRGMGSTRSIIYLDGAPLSSAHDGTYDLSAIPVSIIDHIEIIKSGAGNLGKAVAAGGIINIVTKQADPKEGAHYEISAENGSFLPKKYTNGTETKQDWRSLADSQKLDFTYTNTFGGVALLANIGGYYAANEYTYKNAGDTFLRNNAAAYGIHGNINVNGSFGDDGIYTSKNMVNYQNLRVPGSISWTTPSDYQTTLNLSTSNKVSFKNIAIDASYEYAPLFYHDASNGDDTHNKHKADLSVEEKWDFGETISLTTGEEMTFDFVDSTKVGQHNRIEPRIYANGSFYFLDGKLQLFPMVSVSYVSDFKRVSPNASLGFVVPILKGFDFTLNANYAETAPTFSQMYWPYDYGYIGNPDLKPEQTTGGELGFTYKTNHVNYQGSAFGKYMTNAIVTMVTSYTPYSSSPQNIASSAYFGTEQSVTITPVEGLSISASYIFNKSYNLSDGKTLKDDERINYIRMHTAKMGVSYTYKLFQFSADASYFGEAPTIISYYGNSPYPSFWLLNASISATVTEGLDIHLAVDNLLDTDYSFSYGYPMPGMKIRIGGTWKV